jgi:deoxyribodipyrimidine photo-lyase
MLTTKKPVIIFWFRRDLRLSDNPGLHHAAQLGTILPLFIFDPKLTYNDTNAQAWWLAQSVTSLNESLDGKLHCYQGDAQTIILNLIKKHSVSHVVWNDVYEPNYRKNDTTLQKILHDNNVSVTTFCAHLLWKPDTVVKQDGTPYKVFTPFYKNGCLGAQPPRQPLKKPAQLTCLDNPTNNTDIQKWLNDGYQKWDNKLAPMWKVGESAAHKQLQKFIGHGLEDYEDGRNFPGQKNISRLSAHLHFGEISPHQIWYSIEDNQKNILSVADTACYLKELGWREFCHNLLYFFPQLPTDNFNNQFDSFPWKKNDAFLDAWQQGKTGYPIVDAGMRELAQTGFMHNRVRMIVASFLIKNLLIDWRIGQAWFEEHLVDADLANNSANWQWVAGSGADAAPYFRIFNPVLQGEKFDPMGAYTLHYVPELAKLPKKYIHQPWTAPANVLRELSIIFGKTYPAPIVDLTTSRNAALAAYKNR